MTKDYGVRRRSRSMLGVMVAAAVVVIAGLAVLQISENRAQGEADYKLWMTRAPACRPPASKSFEANGGTHAQLSAFEGVRFGRQHGAVQCGEVGYDEGRARTTFPVCQFDQPGIVEVVTAKGDYWFWPGYISPATIAVQHDVPTCVVGATRDFGHTLVYDPKPTSPRL